MERSGKWISLKKRLTRMICDFLGVYQCEEINNRLESMSLNNQKLQRNIMDDMFMFQEELNKQEKRTVAFEIEQQKQMEKINESERALQESYRVMEENKGVYARRLDLLKLELDESQKKILDQKYEIKKVQDNFEEASVRNNNTKNYFGDTLAHHAFLLRELEKRTNEIQAAVENLFISSAYAERGVCVGGRSKVIQWVQHFVQGDGIGNCILGIKRILDSVGIDNEIWTMGTDVSEKTKTDQNIKMFSYKMIPQEEDLLIFHFGGEAYLSQLFSAYKCFKLLYYHNITPDKFFLPTDEISINASRNGYRQLKELVECTEYIIADSEYNKNDLQVIGFACDINVISVVPGAWTFEEVKEKRVLKQQDEKEVNILFVGRVVAQKKQEDVIRIAAKYQEIYERKVKLYLVGNYSEQDAYYQFLLKECQQYVGLDVYFTGRVSDDELEEYYRNADVFLCMSEHEGLCFPLLESMRYQVPVIAFRAAAIPDTLGNAGVLVNTKDSLVVAKEIEILVSDRLKRLKLIECQNERLEDFSFNNAKQMLLDYFYMITNNNIFVIGEKQ